MKKPMDKEYLFLTTRQIITESLLMMNDVVLAK